MVERERKPSIALPLLPVDYHRKSERIDEERAPDVAQGVQEKVNNDHCLFSEFTVHHAFVAQTKTKPLLAAKAVGSLAAGRKVDLLARNACSYDAITSAILGCADAAMLG